MSSTVLVTGGAGFIGSHVVDQLAAAGYRPRILDAEASPWHDLADVEAIVGDVRRLEHVVRAARGCSAICHLAAAADVADVYAHPVWATDLNTAGTLNVLDAARQLDVGRVVYASTVWVYSDVRAEEVSEEDLLPAPAHLYTAGKLTGELYCRSYAELYGVETTVLRFGIPYGPRARPAAVIPSFLDRAIHGEPLTIAGTGEQERSFVYVEDLAEGVVRALRPEAAGRTYNLASQETTTVRELAEIVREEVGQTEIVHTEGRAGDLRGARVSSERAAAELGWTAATPLREGVRRYAHWIREQDQPAATDAVAVSAANGPTGRKVLSRLLGAISDPFYAGLAAMIAVASAAVSVTLAATDHAQAAALTISSLVFMLPLWALTVTPWPARLRRAQALAAVAGGAFGVILLGLLSGDGDARGDLHGYGLVWLVLLSGCVGAALRIVPRRSADDSA